MYAFGFAGLLVGAYLIDCAFQGRPPIVTFMALLAHPGEVESVLAAYKGQLAPEPYEGDVTSGKIVPGGGGGSW